MSKPVHTANSFGEWWSRRKFLQAMGAGAGFLLLNGIPGLRALAQGERTWKSVIPEPPIKFDPVMNISQNYILNGAIEFIPGESLEDNVWRRWLESAMGLRYEIAWAAASGEAEQQKWATELASGNLPEYLVFMRSNVLSRLLPAGMLEDITDVWERMASATVKEKKGYPDGIMYQPFRGQDRLRVIPISDAEVASNDSLLWIRQDWLDKVGLTVSHDLTLDGLTEIMRAFKAAGLGQYGVACNNTLVTWIGSLDPVFGAFGVMPGSWLKGTDGKLVYSSTQPGTKEALKVLREWFAEGFIAPDFATKNEERSIEDAVAGRAGVMFAPYWANGWPFPDTKTTDPNANWAFYNIPAGPDGRRGRFAHEITGIACGFRKGTDPAKIEAVLHELNWIFERRSKWVENNDFMFAMGPIFEGYDYVVEGDTAKAGPTPIAGPWTYAGSVQGNPASYSYPNMLADWHAALTQIEAMDPAARNPVQQWLITDPVLSEQRKAYRQIFDTLDYQIINEYFGFPSARAAETFSVLQTTERETFVNIITGAQPLESFDEFANNWMGMGGQEVSDDVNAWFQS